MDDDQQRELRDPYALSDYVRQRCTNPQEKYVLLLDEIQYAIAKDELKNTNEPVKRYNIKNKRYFEYPSKFYCTDIGLRNVRLGLRQQEETHIMENLIYNELRMRGFAVDVGNIDVFEKNASGKPVQKNLEVDFIARKGSRKYYIQSALSMDDKAKEQTELRPFDAIDDSFTKIVISKSYGKRWFNKKGILRLGILDFLLDTFLLDNQR